MSSSGVWGRFDPDPRSPQSSRLRASDRDRDVAYEVLGDAFADGRLDHAEYDVRSSAVTEAKVLAELVPHLEDLIPDDRGSAIAGRGPEALSLHEQAVDPWAKDRREAVMGLVGISVITWTIWAATMLGGSRGRSSRCWPPQ